MTEHDCVFKFNIKDECGDEYWSKYFPKLPISIEDDSVSDRMDRILDANPGMSKEQAFLQVMMEIAEGMPNEPA